MYLGSKLKLILRRDQDNDPDGDFQTLVEDTGSAAITYTDETVEPERAYVYRVLAINPVGVSEPSRDVEVSTPSDPNPPVEEQEARQEADQVLLSNLGQSTTPNNFIIGTFEIAQGFRTGPNIPGYTLSSIELDVLRVPNNPDDVTVELWSATSASTPKPNAPVATLTHSTGTWDAGHNTFDAPADTELAAGTTFFVFASYPKNNASDNLELQDTLSTSADAGGAPGWSVRGIFQRNRTSQGNWSGIAGATRIQINGSAVLGPSSGDTPGTVVLSATSPFSPSQPYEGIQLTAELNDPDSAEVQDLKWQWYKLVSGTETETDWRKINGAASRKYTYTPTKHEEGYFLRATASYKQVFSDTTLAQTAHGRTTGYVKGDISEPPGVDFDYDQDSPGRLRVGKSVTGAISKEIGRTGDVFAVDLVRGRRYRIDLEGAATGRGSLANPSVRSVFYLVDFSAVNNVDGQDNDSGRGKNAQITFTAEATATHYIVAESSGESRGTYRLTVQEIVDDLGVWYTDWGAETLGGFLRPNQEATGNLYGAQIIERSGGQRDKDGFLFYLGSD